MAVNLKRGKASYCRFTWGSGSGALEVHFFFNRQFSRMPVCERGTYSKSFRPDYTLVVFPQEYSDSNWSNAEIAAEIDGRIAYLHFDAKYRVENLEAIFGSDEERNSSEDAHLKAGNTVKNVDLYKMHTYNEAIRRTVGSYVLYPGDVLKGAKTHINYKRYNEIIPGIGAFPLKPKVVNGTEPEGLAILMEFIRDLLNHQANKFTQSYRINYWTEETIREPKMDGSASTSSFGVAGKPAKDVQVLLGFVHNKSDARLCRETKVFYCHAVEWAKDKRRKPGDSTKLDFDPFRSELLAVYHQYKSVDWMAEVKDVKLVSAKERALELHKPEKEMKAAYYYRFQLGMIMEQERRNIRDLVSRRPGKPIARSLSEFIKSPAM